MGIDDDVGGEALAVEEHVLLSVHDTTGTLQIVHDILCMIPQVPSI